MFPDGPTFGESGFEYERDIDMPIYEYQCSQCNHQLESFEKMTDTPLTDCPACGKSTLQKLVSASGFQLKGTGWYATDFRQKSDGGSKKEGAATPASSEKSASTDKAGGSDTSSTSTTTTSSTSKTEGTS